jgi:hypothetical protein
MELTSALDLSVINLPNLEQWAAEHARRWTEACGAFLAWERQRILLGDPTEADKAVQRRSLEALLRGTRILYSLLADPNFRDRSLLKEFRGRLWQLEHSWGMFYDNPMTEQEADKLLERYFPGESGA